MSLIKKLKRQAVQKKSAIDNPYVSAQRSWNDHVGGVTASRRMWQLVGVSSLLIVLASVGGMIHIGGQSKFVPYVVEVDQLGRAAAVAPAQVAAPVDQRVVRSALASFINDARMVSPDVALQRKAIFSVYSMLAPANPATGKMNEWLNGSESSNPFKRAATETATVEIISVLAQTAETWQVEWKETVRNRQGAVIGAPSHMRALMSIFVVPPTSATKEEQIR